MRLVLALPGLLAPDPRAAALRARGLARLIAAAGPPSRESEGIGAVLAPRYAIARQADWPLAPLRLAALGLDPGSAYWLAADPVSLVAGRDDVLFGGTVDDLEPAHADAMIATLNCHFRGDGLHFVAPRPDAWFVRVASSPRVTTHALDAAAGRALRALLPEGPDAPQWRRWISEIQMLLHEHPVNVERERSGIRTVTGVWFSGGGTLPPRGKAGARTRTWANGGIATALAMHAGAPARALPASLAAAFHEAGVDEHVVVFDSPLDLARIDTAWGEPAWNALAARKLETLTVIADGAGDALAWTAPRPGRWQRIRLRFTAHELGALLNTVRAIP